MYPPDVRITTGTGSISVVKMAKQSEQGQLRW